MLVVWNIKDVRAGNGFKVILKGGKIGRLG